jgi:serine protease Do
MVAETQPDTTSTLTVLRDKDKKEFKVAITELPKDLANASQGGPESSKGEHALAGITVEENKDRSGKGRQRGGVVVTDVEPDSAAERAGVRPGDVIMEINRKSVRTVADFDKLTGQLNAKAPVLLLINRGSATIFLSIAP